MQSDDERRKMIANMPDDVKARALDLYNMVENAIQANSKYSSMTNEQIATELINGPWAELPMFSSYSELIDIAADRLKTAEAEAARLREALHPVMKWLQGYKGEFPEDLWTELVHAWDALTPPAEGGEK